MFLPPVDPLFLYCLLFSFSFFLFLKFMPQPNLMKSTVCDVIKGSDTFSK